MKAEKGQKEDLIACPKCQKIFNTRTDLTEHLKGHTNDQIACPICYKELSSSSSRDRHLLTHSKERPYKCAVCGEDFTTNGNMNRHFRRHSVKDRQNKKIAKVKHRLSHNVERNFSREEVNTQANVPEEPTETLSRADEEHRYFQSLELRRKSSIAQLNKNQDLVPDNEVKLQKLPTKPKKTFGWSELAKIPPTAHEGSKLERTDTETTGAGSSGGLLNLSTDTQDLAGITEIISNVQPKTSSQSTTDASSTRHQYQKSSIKHTFACQSCTYIAKDKNTLEMHSKKHNRNGKFKCQTCGITFTNKTNARRHVKERHGLQDREAISAQIKFVKEDGESEDEKIFTCKYCHSTFDNEQALQHHLRSNECKMKPYFCTICMVGSSTKNNCFRHIENKHSEIFRNEMTSEEKNEVKEKITGKRSDAAPQRDEDRTLPPVLVPAIIESSEPMELTKDQEDDDSESKLEAAEGLCRLSENRQVDNFAETVCPTKEFYHATSNRLANVEAPSTAVETSPVLIIGVGPGSSKSIGTVSSMAIGTNLSMIQRSSPSMFENRSEFLQDSPLDLSINPLDLSLKRANKSLMALPQSKGHFQSAQNFGKNQNNLQKQKPVITKQNSKNFRCQYCEKTFSKSAHLHRHYTNMHGRSPAIKEGSLLNPIRKDLLREYSVNSSVKHSDSTQIKNSRSSVLINAKFNASFERGTGSDTENDLASIPSIQSTVNQGIHISHPCCAPNMYSVFSRKRPFSDLQSSDSSSPERIQKKKQPRIGHPSPTLAACSPVSRPQQVVTTPLVRFSDGGSIGGNNVNNTSACDLSKSNHNFKVRVAETAEPSTSEDKDLICCYCFSQFSSKEHVKSHIKELHYLEHNKTAEVPDEKSRWKKERLSKLRQ